MTFVNNDLIYLCLCFTKYQDGIVSGIYFLDIFVSRFKHTTSKPELLT